MDYLTEVLDDNSGQVKVTLPKEIWLQMCLDHERYTSYKQKQQESMRRRTMAMRMLEVEQGLRYSTPPYKLISRKKTPKEPSPQ